MIRNTCNMVARVRASYYYDPMGAEVLTASAVPRVVGTSAYVTNSYHYAGMDYVQQPRTRVEIDLNVRVRGNDTFVSFDDISGPVAVGEAVEVYESESGVSGEGRITEIDGERELVYLSVDWASLTEASGSSCPEVSTTGTQLLCVGTFMSTTTLLQAPWMELAPRPCLATVDGGNGAMWVTAPLYETTSLLLNVLAEPYADMRQLNVASRGVLGVAA